MTELRYIKLGDHGCHEDYCIVQKPCILLQYVSPHHQDCLIGNWGVVKQFWRTRITHQGTVTNHMRQIRDFYELSQDCIWITFYANKMYWCKAEKNINILPNGNRTRTAIEGWSFYDKNSKVMNFTYLNTIDPKIVMTRFYNGTICEFKDAVHTEILKLIR